MSVVHQQPTAPQGMELAGERIFHVDFHCQWMHKGLAPIFLAGLSYQGFDAGVMVVPSTFAEIQDCLRRAGSNFLAIQGREHTYNWGHVISVGHSGDVEGGQADFRKTLTDLKAKSRMVIFAHPLHAPTRPALWDTGVAEELLAEGLFDAFELVNSYNLGRDLELVDWYERKLAQGSAIPITGGCDTHYLQADSRPSSVYSPAFPPCGATVAESDIDGQGGLRTLVLADACTEEAIVDAVLRSRTLVESQGRLFGPKALVDKLLAAGYWEAAKADLERRRALALVPGGKFVGGAGGERRLKLHAPVKNGRLTANGKAMPFSGGEVSLAIPNLAHEADEAWMSLAVSDLDSRTELVSAINVVQPVDIDFFGGRKAGAAYISCAVRNNTDNQLSGRIVMEMDGACQETGFGGLAPGASMLKALPVRLGEDWDVPEKAQVQVELPDGGKRAVSRELTFVGCRHAADPMAPDWSKAELIRLNRREQVGLGNWDGPEDLSAEVKMLWSAKGLHLLAKVKDNIHVQPFHGGELYQGDCVQFGVDAFFERGKTQSPMYEFLMGLADTGPELFCTIVPTKHAGLEPNPPNSFLPKDCVKIDKTNDGLVYEAVIPWDWLRPFKPEVDSMFGLFILLFDNDGEQYEVGSGCKSIMIWPGGRLLGWKSGTRHWAAITLLD